jgi:DNA-binding CsgD family transcriptional regulator
VQGSDARPGRVLSAEELARIAADVLGASQFPALVLEVPSQRIVAAGPRASHLLDPTGATVVDHLLEEFTADRPVLGTDLLAGGRLNGFESFRILRRARGADVKVRMWVRTFERQSPTRLVLLILVADEPMKGPHLRSELEELPPTPAVVGTVNAQWQIERISADAEDLFDVPVADLIGLTLADLVAKSDVPVLMGAFETASKGTNGVTVVVDVHPRGNDGADKAIACEILLLPLHPALSCAFVLLPTPLSTSKDQTTESLPAILGRLGKGAEIAHLARGVFSGATDRDVPGLADLTTRELEIVGRLLDGDRAPAIATRLFVTQSTVRNHLAAVFAKLGVNSQQQLLNLFRRS